MTSFTCEGAVFLDINFFRLPRVKVYRAPTDLLFYSLRWQALSFWTLSYGHGKYKMLLAFTPYKREYSTSEYTATSYSYKFPTLMGWTTMHIYTMDTKTHYGARQCSVLWCLLVLWRVFKLCMRQTTLVYLYNCFVF